MDSKFSGKVFATGSLCIPKALLNLLAETTIVTFGGWNQRHVDGYIVSNGPHIFQAHEFNTKRFSLLGWDNWVVTYGLEIG